MMKFTFNCCLCMNKVIVELPVPEGWATCYNEKESENDFCPEHADIASFRDSQCPGCVGGWGDCSMWSAFAYEYKRSIHQDDYDSLERGICPRRTGGTFGFNTLTGQFKEIDLREDPVVEGGRAFSQAIKEYIERYPSSD